MPANKETTDNQFGNCNNYYILPHTILRTTDNDSIYITA